MPSHVTAETFYATVGFKTVREVFRGDARTIVMKRHLVGKEHEGVAKGVSWREGVRANIDRLYREIIGLFAGLIQADMSGGDPIADWVTRLL